MRTLTISGHAIPLLGDRALELIRDKVLYKCEVEGHDLHLVPDTGTFDLDQVEKLCLAIVSDQTPWR